MELAVPGDQFGRNLDLAVHHVAMDFDVSRPLLGPYRLDHFVQLFGGGARIDQHLERAGHFAVDALLRFDLARLMMDQRTQLALALARAAGKNQHRHPLREGAGYRVDHVVAAGAVGHAGDADAAGGARVAVGGETDSRLVRQGQHLEPVFAARG